MEISFGLVRNEQDWSLNARCIDQSSMHQKRFTQNSGYTQIRTEFLAALDYAREVRNDEAALSDVSIAQALDR